MAVLVQGIVVKGCQLEGSRPIIYIISRDHDLDLEFQEEKSKTETCR